MNTQQSASRVAPLALLALVVAAAVIAVLLLGGSWPRWAFYTAIIVGIAVAAGAVGALVKVLARNGN